MKPAENIEKLIKNLDLDLDTNAKTDQRILKELNEAHEKSKKMNSALIEPNIRRIIMKSPITKLAAAAVIIIAVTIGINQFGGSIDMANISWAEVTSRVAQVDYVHVYWLKSRGDVLFRQFEAWSAHGKLVMRGDKGSMTYDDGQTQQKFDEQGRRIGKGQSFFAEGQIFLEVFTAGLLSDKNGQLSQQKPANVGDDFLIYEFDPPPEMDHSEWLESVVITVGKNSLLPVQMKIYDKEGDYDLAMFDYEAAEKPREFFVPPTVGSANCGGKVVLDGEEVVLNIEGAPGLKQAVVRLSDKYDGPAEQFPLDYISSERLSPDFCKAVSEGVRKKYEKKGGPIFRLEVSFVTDEGYESATLDFLTVRLNEAGQCGVGSASGGLDEWPDGKYRNIKFSPLLKSTDRENTYIIEIRCWLRPKEN